MGYRDNRRSPKMKRRKAQRKLKERLKRKLAAHKQVRESSGKKK